MRAQRRDANEREIVKFWADLGAAWIPMDRDAGFDGILLWRGQKWIVEIKNGTQLTPREESRKTQVESVGVQYHIIENKRQAAELVGVDVQ